MSGLKPDSATGYRLAAVATLAAAVAAITMLAGIVQLRPLQLGTAPLIATNPLPLPSWPHTWLGSLRTAQSLQSAAVVEWLNVVLALVLTIVVMAAASALIALFAHASARRYETALRAVVGATRSRIRCEQFGKAMSNVAIAVGAGVSVGLLAAVIANRTWPHNGLRIVAGQWVLVSLVFAAGIAALVARAAAARTARPGWLGDAVAPEARSNPGYGAEDLRNALLHLQFAFTFALLAAALLVSQHSRRTIQSTASAANDSYVTRIALDENLSMQQRRDLIASLEQTGLRAASPGVLTGVGHSDHVLANCGRCNVANMMLPMFAVRTQQHVVGAGFLEAAGLRMRYGREFEAGDEAKQYVVVNDTFVEVAFRGQHAIGRSIQVGGLRGEWYTVIGVVPDLPISGLISFRPDDRTLVNPTSPGRVAAIYFHTGERPPRVFDVVSNAPVNVTRAGLAASPSRLLSRVQADAGAPAVWFAGVLGVLALMAALVAVLSLGALTLLNVRQRELEIAARRSVGARRRDIIRMILGSTALTATRGTFVGILLSIAVARAIQMVLPEMRIFDPAILAASVALVAVASLVAAVIPARAAARIMPAQIHT